MFSVPPGVVENDWVLWDMLMEIICKKGYGGKIGIQGDLAADCYYDHEKRIYQGLFDSKERTPEQLIETIIDITKKYPFVDLEDPLEEDDFEGHAILTKETGIQIVGDDLFSTTTSRVKKGIAVGACNTVLLKVNQVGSITESLEMIQLAYENGYGVMPCSSRGENIDICDYSVGINATTIRESGLGSIGSRFLEIEEELGCLAQYAGTQGLKGSKFH
jgi:enolase